MTPLYQDPCFTFRFAEDRLISRFHLESVPAGRQVSVFKVDPSTGQRLSLLRSAIAGKEGWVDLAQPIVMRAGEAFIAVPEPRRLTYSPGQRLLYAIGVVGFLALAGFLCGLIQGTENALIVAACCAGIGAFVVFLGYGPIALVIGVLGTFLGRFKSDRSRSDGTEHRR